MTEPRAEVEATGAPEPCASCGHPIAPTVLGWMHLDAQWVPTSWLCPDEDTVATPGLTGPEPAGHPSAGTPAPRPRGPRPTPIPPRPNVGQGRHHARPALPGEWPPPSGHAWWENRSPTSDAASGRQA